MSYMVKHVFPTIQGEGYHAGTPCVFVRLAGCNLWSGREQDRASDAARNGAHCPVFCDTDFRGGRRMTAPEVVAAVEAVCGPSSHVVISGGEPLLQIDDELLLALFAVGFRVAIETNGTVPYKGDAAVLNRAWVTLSPKRERAHTALLWANELKLVIPDYSPADWELFTAAHRFVQPRAHTTHRDTQSEDDAVAWVMANPGWRLSVQLHKVLGVE